MNEEDKREVFNGENKGAEKKANLASADFKLARIFSGCGGDTFTFRA